MPSKPINEYKYLGNLTPIIHTQKAQIHDLLSKHEKERRGKVRRLMKWRKEPRKNASRHVNVVQTLEEGSGGIQEEEFVLPQPDQDDASSEDTVTQYDSDDSILEHNFYPTAEEALGLKTPIRPSTVTPATESPMRLRKKRTIEPRLTPQKRMQLPQLKYGEVPSLDGQRISGSQDNPSSTQSGNIHLWIDNPRNMKRSSFDELPLEPTDPSFAHQFLKKQKLQQLERNHAFQNRLATSKENIHGLKEEARRIIDALNESDLYKDKYDNLMKEHLALQEQHKKTQNKYNQISEKLELWKHQMLTKDSMLVVNMKREESLVRKLRLKVTEHEEINKQFQNAVDWLFKIGHQTHLSSDDIWFLYHKLTKLSQRALDHATRILASKYDSRDHEEYQMMQLKKNYDSMFETHRRVIMESFALQTEVDPDEREQTKLLREQFEEKFQSRRYFFTWTTSRMSELEQTMQQYEQLVNLKNRSDGEDALNNSEMLQDVSLMKLQHSQLLLVEEFLQKSFHQFLSMNLAESKTETKQKIVKDVQRIFAQCERFLLANNVPDSKRIEVLSEFQTSIRDAQYEVHAVRKEHDTVRKECAKQMKDMLAFVTQSIGTTLQEKVQESAHHSQGEVEKLNQQLLYFTKRFNESQAEKKAVQKEFAMYKESYESSMIELREKNEALRKELKNLVQLRSMMGG